MNFSERTYLWYISLLRIYVGYYLLFQGVRKFQRDFPKGDWIGRQIGDLTNLDLYKWYKKFIIDTVLPNKEVFRDMIIIGEITDNV